MKPVLLLLLALFALQPQPAGAAAQVVSEAPTVQPGARTFRIHSERTGGDYLVEVTASPLPALPGQRFPALYALDGGYGLVGPTARFLVSLAAVDAVYVVSIDSAPDQPAARDRDMLYHPSQRNGAAIGGGGAAFQAFLTEELRPLLERRFPLDPDRAVLFGHSLTGLFTASLLAQRSDAFSVMWSPARPPPASRTSSPTSLRRLPGAAADPC